MKRSFADILQDLDSSLARKLARKLPSWSAAAAEIPSSLSLEQCSSEATAAYKAGLAGLLQNRSRPWLREREGPGRQAGRDSAQRVVLQQQLPSPAGYTILDLTGGLGVDSWAFAQVAERVVYYERDAALAAAAARNFERLGAANIELRCETVSPRSELPEADLIYADPARRNAAGRKVFLLEDCTPDILTLLPLLLRKAPAVLLKLSPMADLAMLADRLGPALREIHVVELDGEVKEILCLLVRNDEPAEPKIIIALLTSGATIEFRFSEEREARARFAAELRPGELLLEPCPALLKAGAFRLPCERWGLLKLAPSTHLYTGHIPEPLRPSSPFPTSTSEVTGPGRSADADYYTGHIPEPLRPSSPFPTSASEVTGPETGLFKPWKVREVMPFGAASFKELRQRYPRAELTARNLPVGSEELRKRLGIAPGGDVHIFACSLADGSAVLLVTESGR